jgi:hypothetical protein
MACYFATALLLAGIATGDTAWLTSREYRLRITATEGPMKGHSALGAFSLRKTSADDRSSSGVRAKDRNLAAHPLFGWTDVQFDEVGAPMARAEPDRPEPSPTSTDPVFPGVLVDIGWKPSRPRGRPQDAPIIWIASAANRRDGSMVLDGGGIVLFVMKRSTDCLTGVWQEAGIIRLGRGTFELCR